MSKTLITESPPMNTKKFKNIAKAYQLANILTLLVLCFIISIFCIPFFMSDPSAPIGTSPFWLLIPTTFAISNILLLITTTYLGAKVINIGWGSSFLLSCFGSFITTIIFTRLTADQLKKNGYKVGLIKATQTV